MPGIRKKIGELFFSLRADSSGLKRELDEAGQKAEQESNRIVGGFKKMGDAATKFQAIVSRILIPAAVATAIVGLINRFRQLIDEAHRFQKALDDITRSADARFRSQRQELKAVSEDERKRLAVMEQQRTEVDQLVDKIEELGKESIGGKLTRGVLSWFSDAPVTYTEKMRAAEMELQELRKRHTAELGDLDRKIAADKQKAEAKAIEEQLDAQNTAALELAALEKQRRDEAQRELEERAKRTAEEFRKQYEAVTKATEQMTQNVIRQQEVALRNMFDRMSYDISRMADAMTQLNNRYRTSRGR